MVKLIKNFFMNLLLCLTVMILSTIGVLWFMDAKDLGGWNIQESCIKILSDK